MLKKLLIALGVFCLIGIAHATTVFNSNQVGTGAASGTYLQTNGVTSTWANITFPSGTATTTINGQQCPTFTFSLVATTSQSSLTTSTCALFWNLLYYTSGTNINVSANGVINFVNPGYITTSTVQVTAPITGNGSPGNPVTCPSCIVTAPTITLTGPVTGSGNGTFATTITSPLTVNVSSSIVTSTSICLGGVCNTSWPTGGTPAGTSTDVQLNSGGAFAADTGNFTENSSTHVLTTNGTSIPSVSAGSYSVTTTMNYSYTYTGATSSWTVPADISGGVTISVFGAGSFGAVGGSATGTIASPAGTYFYSVGQTGIDSSTVSTYGGGAGGGTGTGVGTQAGGGSGGGMSWFSKSGTFSQSTVIMVAGGAGGDGAQGGGTGVSGGNGGGSAGLQGVTQFGATGGGPGTQSGVGAGGAGADGGGSGSSGSGQTGGVGGNGNLGGGGGGGGYFAGGGGGVDNNHLGSYYPAGGGGGSGFVSSTVFTSISSSTNGSSTGMIRIAYITVDNFSPSITGNNNAGFVQVVTSTSNATITFANPVFAHKPSCYITPSQSGQTNPPYITASTTYIAVTFSNALTNGQSFNYLCWGY